MKNLLEKLIIGLGTAGYFYLGLTVFWIVFEPFWVSNTFGYINYENFSRHNIQGAFLFAFLITIIFFLPYFVITGVFTASVISVKSHSKKARLSIELIALTPFMFFNLMCFIVVSGDWIGLFGNDILFFLGVFLILFPSTGAFVYFCERYYKKYQDGKL